MPPQRVDRYIVTVDAWHLQRRHWQLIEELFARKNSATVTMHLHEGRVMKVDVMTSTRRI